MHYTVTQYQNVLFHILIPPPPPPTDGIGIPRSGVEHQRLQNLKESMKINWNFQRVLGGQGRFLKKISSVGEVGVFSGTT